MSETVPFSEAKAHLSDLADRVEREHDRVLVTRNGRPSFVLISPDDLDSLEETLDIARDEALLASIKKSRREAAAGKTVPVRDQA
jgi:prevent-host-death family protein